MPPKNNKLYQKSNKTSNFLYKIESWVLGQILPPKMTPKMVIFDPIFGVKIGLKFDLKLKIFFVKILPQNLPKFYQKKVKF